MTPIRLERFLSERPDVCIAAEGLALDRVPWTAGGKAPGEVQLFSEGQWAEHPRGKVVVNERFMDELIANLAAAGTDPVVDLEHESFFGYGSPRAQGWCKALRKGPDPKNPERLALFATVEWTDLGEENVAKKYFRYISPGWQPTARDRRTGKPIGAALDHVALVKNPFFQGMQALTASHHFPGPGRADGEDTMNELNLYLAKLLKAPADADEAAILVLARKHEATIIDVLEHGPGVRLSADALEALSLASGAVTGEAASVAIVELGRKAVANGELTARVAKLEDEKIVAAVTKARKDRLITPAEEPGQLKLAKANFGLWEELLAKRTPIGHEQIETGTKNRKGGDRLAAQEKALEDYKAKHKDASDQAAYIACANANPELFNDEVI